jgi:hypothetical protein
MVLLAVAPPATGAADPIAYGSNFPGETELITWDLAAGTFAVVGPMGLGDVPVRHFTFGPDGTLYGIDHEQGRLLTLDPLSGQATVVGPFDDPDPIVFGGFAADACGRLWATGSTSDGDPGCEVDHWLFGIDPATGHLERLASGDSYELYGLAGRGEQLWGLVSDGLVRIDLHDLSVHEIGDSFLGYPRGLGFAADGALWGSTWVPPPPITLPPNAGQYTLTVDLATGAPDIVGTWIPIPSGDFTIGPPLGNCFGGAPLAVPALGPLGVGALVLLLACGGLLMIARSHLRPVRP